MRKEDIKIIPYNSSHKEKFICLNTAWIKKSFEVEPQDLEMLDHIEDYIQIGAVIYVALYKNQVISTCMIVPKDADTWEICKFATDKHYEGNGAGSLIFEKCLDYAKIHHAKKIIIVTNTILDSAMHLYTKFGFQPVPIDNMEYNRVNIQLELKL